MNNDIEYKRYRMNDDVENKTDIKIIQVKNLEIDELLNENLFNAVLGDEQEVKDLLNGYYFNKVADINAKIKRCIHYKSEIVTPIQYLIKKHIEFKLLKINHISEILLQNGVDITIVDKNQETLLMLAVKSHDLLDLVKLLVKYNIDINAQNNIGATALLIAIQYKFFDAAEFLIDSGADVNLCTGNYTSPLYLAIRIEILISFEPTKPIELAKKIVNSGILLKNSPMYKKIIDYIINTYGKGFQTNFYKILELGELLYKYTDKYKNEYKYELTLYQHQLNPYMKIYIISDLSNIVAEYSFEYQPEVKYIQQAKKYAKAVEKINRGNCCIIV